jgi:hypothetical protein
MRAIAIVVTMSALAQGGWAQSTEGLAGEPADSRHTVEAQGTAAQSAEALLGRDARVWAGGAVKPVSGVVTHATGSFLRLSTGARVCTPDGCRNSFSARWEEIERIQVNSQSRRERILRAVLIGGGAGAILTLGIRACQGSSGRIDGHQVVGGRTREQIDTCKVKVTGFTIAAGTIGLILSQPSWDDVPLPLEGTPGSVR